ncbi:molecular chaperone [Natrialbaceae archaeon GCM10025810]|uniref:TorD/DmsD family molecular chaperone n=1 Tax=Halovalidus salilacus TaxID=3075124 RepID=UPI0036093408
MTARTNVHRARLYKLASLAFDRPTEEVEEALTTGEFAEQLLESAAALADEGGADDLRERAEAVVADCPEDPDGVDDLYSSYSSLFGFERGGDVAQYELAYAPGTLVVNTNELADIAGFYEAFGLSVADGNRDRVDHLPTQLEFCSHLALQAAYLELDEDETGLEIVTDAGGAFVEDHLGRWIPRFRETVHEETDAAFYRALANLVDALVSFDADRFGVEPRPYQETGSSPTDAFLGDDDGADFRCGTCGLSSSEPNPSQGEPQMPMGDRNGPY